MYLDGSSGSHSVTFDYTTVSSNSATSGYGGAIATSTSIKQA